MQRRNFLKGLSIATAAGIARPAKASSGSAAIRPEDPTRTPGDRSPLVERTPAQARSRSGMALGGIGAGFVELRKDGKFYNWSIFNNFPKETGPALNYPSGEVEDPLASSLFFKVRYEVEGEEPRIKLLQLSDGLNEGGTMGIAFTIPWMQAVEQIEYSARFPFATLRFTDPEMPFEITMKAWSPFIPHDVKNSSLPVIYFDFEFKPLVKKPVDVMLIMSMRNMVGYDTLERYYTTHIVEDRSRKTVAMSCEMDHTASTWGQLALTSMAPGATHYTGWSILHPYYEYMIRNKTLPNLDDTDGTASMQSIPDWMPVTSGRNFIDPKTGRKRIHAEGRFEPAVYSSLANSFTLSASSPQARSFMMSWNFPNLYADDAMQQVGLRIEGHYYSNFFTDAAEVVNYAASGKVELYERTLQFQQSFFDSSAEIEVLEQINSQLNTFVTSGRLVKSGDFGVLEGLASTWSWGPVATIDVMLYGTASVIALFPELQRRTMRCHARIQSGEGEVAHGLLKNFDSSEDGTNGVSHRLDLPGQFVMMALRDYFWTNDLEYLHEMYPHIQRAISYIVTHRAFAGDSIPIMRGIECSYDNFPMYGYASYLLSQWICALAGAVIAAEAMNDHSHAVEYAALLGSAREMMERKLWNGSYYRLYNDENKAGQHGGVSEGILTDQIIGQWMAHQSGLGYQLDKQRVRKALRSILAANFSPSLGLRNCSWPGYSFLSPVAPDIWTDQANTLWSGIELAFASFLLYEGMYDEAIQVIRTVDHRYRKNGLYWNHQEFGGHYFRPMAAWAIVNGYLGLSVNCGRIRFDPKLKTDRYRLFFATTTGTAHYIAAPGTVRLCCRSGGLKFRQLEIRGMWKGGATLSGVILRVKVSLAASHEEFTTWEFDQVIEVPAGSELVLS